MRRGGMTKDVLGEKVEKARLIAVWVTELMVLKV